MSNTPILYLLIPLAILFALLVQHHAKLFDRKNHLQNLVKINHFEIQALAGNFSAFKTGAEFIDTHHPYSHDLDIFGEASLFQRISRANTLDGISRLAGRLTCPLTTAAEINANREAIEELSGKTDFRQHLQAAGMEIDEEPKDREQLLEWIKHPTFLYGKRGYRIMLIVVPFITIALILGWVYSPVFRPFAIFMAAFQWTFLGFHIKRINRFHDYISRKKNILNKYAHLLYYLQHENFSSIKLTTLSKQAADASERVKDLGSLVHALDARLNSMTSIFVNSLLLYDLQCVYRLEKWKSQNAGNLKAWLEGVSETEVLSSLATFAFNNPHFTYATIHDDLSITTHEMGHPLIVEQECVTNNFVIGKPSSIMIITGANMAGKSTFLRSLGVNIVLALNAAPVFAQRFQCPIIRLRTGMRTADSLREHQSYFHAELNRLKGIMDELRSGTPLLILLDEILKGTNSTDKQAGSIAFVKQLLHQNCLSVIATHDLALGDLEREYPQQIKNYSFEATIDQDQLSFDYKLKPGLARKMNATFLMKKMGIIPS